MAENEPSKGEKIQMIIDELIELEIPEHHWRKLRQHTEAPPPSEAVDTKADGK